MPESTTLIRVLMPHMGESIVEGRILRWLKREGEPVRRDETIAEAETDKADVEIPAPADGVLSKIVAKEGAMVPVGAEIAQLEPRDATTTRGWAATPDRPPVAQFVAPSPDRPAPITVEKASGQLTITPVVAKLMKRHSLGLDDLRNIRGTGAEGRVTKQDILLTWPIPPVSVHPRRASPPLPLALWPHPAMNRGRAAKGAPHQTPSRNRSKGSRSQDFAARSGSTWSDPSGPLPM